MARTQRITLSDSADVRVIDNNFQVLEGLISGVMQLNIPITNWTEATDSDSKTYYYQTFSVSGLKSTDTPIISLKVDDTINIADNKDQLKGYNNLFAYECGENTFTLYSHKVPTTAYTILLKGVGV